MSSAFVRSSSGLSNKHLFHNVDYMVFVEGGAESGHDEETTDQSIDEVFWGIVFGVFAPTNVKYRIQCQGGKDRLLAIAKRIRKGLVSNTVVAIDRDYDDFAGRNPSDDAVLITRGYSWENDVWQEDICFRVIRTTCPLGGADNVIQDTLSDAFNDLNNDCRFLAWADSILYCSGRSLLATKYKKEFVSLDTSYIPYIDTNRIRTRLKQARRQSREVVLRRVGRRSLRGANDIKGKLVAHFAIELINGLFRSFRVRDRLGPTNATGVAMRELEGVLRTANENNGLGDYYAELFRRLDL